MMFHSITSFEGYTITSTSELKLSSGLNYVGKISFESQFGLKITSANSKNSATDEQYFSPTKLGISKVLRADLEYSNLLAS